MPASAKERLLELLNSQKEYWLGPDKYESDVRKQLALGSGIGMAGVSAVPFAGAGQSAVHTYKDLKGLRDVAKAPNRKQFNTQLQEGDIFVGSYDDDIKRNAGVKAVYRNPYRTHAMMAVKGSDGVPKLVPVIDLMESKYRRITHPGSMALLREVRNAVKNPKKTILFNDSKLDLNPRRVADRFKKRIEFLKNVSSRTPKFSLDQIGDSIANYKNNYNSVVRPAVSGELFRFDKPLSDAELDAIRNRYPTVGATQVDDITMGQAGLKRLLGPNIARLNQQAKSLTCSGGICEVLQGTRPSFNPSSVIPSDIPFLPKLKRVAAFNRDPNAAKTLLSSGIRNVGLRGLIGAGVLLPGAALIAHGMSKDKPN